MIGLTYTSSKSFIARVTLMSLAISLLPPVTAFASQVRSDSMLAYWKLDETSGAVAADSSRGLNTNASAQNGPTISTDTAPTAFANARSRTFNGTNQSINTSGAVRTTGNVAFTYSLWVKTTDSTDAYRTMFSEGHTGVANAIFQLQMTTDADTDCPTDDSFKAYMRDNAGTAAILCSATAYNDGEWHNVILTSNGSNSHALYVDGVSVDTDTTAISTTTFNVAAIGMLRSTTASQYFTGSIDEVRVYKRVLSAAEIADLVAGRHTAAVWDGSTSTGFENGTNWSTDAVPDPYTRLTIPFTTNKLTLTGSIAFSELTIGSGTVVKLNGTGASMLDNGTFTNYGALALRNTETVNLSISPTKGSIILMGTGATTGLQLGNQYNNLTLNDGLITYLKFDEASGTRAADSSGYFNSGSLVNGASFSTTVAPLGFANPDSASFDGINDSVAMQSTPNELVGSGSKMVTMWVRPTQASNGLFFMGPSGGGSQAQSFRILTTGAGLLQVDISSGVVTSALAVPQNTWSLVSVSWNARSSAWVACVNMNCETLTLPQSRLAQGLYYVGYDEASSTFMKGNIDDVRVYNRVLLNGELAALVAGNEPSTARGSVTLNAALTVLGDLTLNGSTLDVSSSDYQVRAYGNWMNNGGVFNARKGSVLLTSDDTAVVQTGGQRFNDAYFQNGGSWTLRDKLTASGVVTLQEGTLDTNATGNYSIRAGEFSDSGVGTTFLHRSGTVTLTNSSDTQLSFYAPLNNLRIEDPTEYGLVGYWKFDEGTNTGAILDSSGHNNTGLRSGTGSVWSGTVLPSLTYGDAFAMRFNGYSDHVSVPDSSSLDLTGSASFSTWVKWGSAIGTDDDSFIDKTQSGDSPNYRLYLVNSGGEAGKFGFWNGTTSINSTSTVSRGAWRLLTLVIDSGTASFYIDGALDKTASIGLGSVNNGPLLIGTDPQTVLRHFNGYLDDVRIYNRPLSADEVASLYSGKYADGDNDTSTVELISGLEVNSLSVCSGIFSGGSETMHIASDLNNYSGDSGFDATFGTAIFDGPGAQTIRGSNTFGTLEISGTTARTVSFESNKTQTVQGSLTLQGASSNLLALAPLSGTTPWYLNLGVGASQSVSYVTPSYSDASPGITILADNGTNVDGGGNANWQFTAAASSSTATEDHGGNGGRRTETLNAQSFTYAAEAIAARFRDRGTTVAQTSSSSSESSLSSRASRSSSSKPVDTLAQRAEDEQLLLVTLDDLTRVLFTDVHTDTWYAPYVSVLAEEGIAEGYKDASGNPKGEFGVMNPVTRAEVLKMAMEASGIKPVGDSPRNTSAKGTWASGYVKAAENMNISVFTPTTDVNAAASRGEVVQIILEAAGFPLLPTWDETFSDVPKSNVHARAIATAAAYQLIKGDTDANGMPLGTFRPNDQINRAEVAKIIALLWQALK